MPKSKQAKGPKAKCSKAKIKAVVHPRATDILFGRGGHVNHHKANQYYLELVSDRKEQYQNCKKVDKASIAWDIIRQLQDQTPSPRFLKKDYTTGLWHAVNENEVRRKISQCLRERAVPVLPKKNKAKAKKAVKSKLLEHHGSAKGKGNCTNGSDADSEEESPRYMRAKQREISEGLVEIFAKQDGGSEATRSQNQEIPIPASVCTPHRQVLFQPDRSDIPTSRENNELYVAPPMPVPVPIPQPTRLGESARAWSDFLTGSFASFTPSIFDASGVENAWENLLDPSTLPQLCNDDDDESFPGSLTSDESSAVCASTIKSSPKMNTMSLPTSNCREQTCISSPPGLTPNNKDLKTQTKTDTSETVDVEPISVDSFFSCEVMSLGKVLEHSCLNSYTAAL